MSLADITPLQLDTIAHFLEAAREHLGIDGPIRLTWPRRRHPVKGARSPARRRSGGSPVCARCP